MLRGQSAYPPAPEDGGMVFRPKPGFVPVPELEQLLRHCPSAESYVNGFSLGDADCDEIVRAAQVLEGSQVYVDPALIAREPQRMADLLARTTRLLQVALDMQFQENEQHVSRLNGYEERERALMTELERLRGMQDRFQLSAGAAGLQQKCDDLAQRLDEEYRSNDRMRMQRERDERHVADLEYRLHRAEATLTDRDERLRAADHQYTQLTEAFNDLRNSYDVLRTETQAMGAKQQLGDMMRQQGWRMERMTKENRALELQNVELRKQAADVRAENLEVSEKIVLLDDEMRKLRALAVEAETRAEQLQSDKKALLSTNESLRTEVTDKMALLEEFEARFQRQYKSWEEERTTLLAQIDAMHVKGLPTTRTSRSTEDFSNVDQEELQELREELSAAREKEILLLEAYEQLEKDVGKEIDLALSKQGEELKAAQRRADFLTQRMDQEREGSRALKEHQALLEDQIKDALLRNKQYEGGMYGLPQAVEEIHALKEAVYKEQGRVREMVQQLSKVTGKVEDLHDENTVLRKRAGLGASEAVDLQGVRMQKQASIAQLRSLNALLERQVADLEEERRKLRMELKFRAKFHGQHALEMGLSPDQLLLLEQLVDDIKHGRNDEARIVDQMQHRIEFLEVRLAEVMAYADIPPSMRPALTEYDPFVVAMGQRGPSQQAGEGTGAAGGAGLLGGLLGGMLGSSNLRATQLDSIKAQLLRGLATLRNVREGAAQRSTAGGAGTGGGGSRGAGDAQADFDLARLMDSLAAQLMDCQQAVEAVLQDTRRDAAQQQQQQQGGAGQLGPQPSVFGGQAGVSSATEGSGTTAGGGGTGVGGRPRGPGGGNGRFEGLVGQGQGAGRVAGFGQAQAGGPGGARLQQQQQQQQQTQGDFLEDAMADELRAKLREMAKELAGLQATVIQKDATLQQLAEQKGQMEAKFGPVSRDRHPDIIPRQDYENLSLECASLKEQLVQSLEELSARERECQELADAGARHQSKMQTFSDQIKLVYRDYANAVNAWKVEKKTMEKRIKKLQEDADSHKASDAEHKRGLDALTRNPDLPALHKELGDTVRRMAIVQIKHAKIARELEASVMSEKALNERVEALEQEVKDVSSTCRARMRWLEQASDSAKRRVEALFRELQTFAPLAAYHMLVSKHARQQTELRRLLEESADQVVARDEVYQLREEMAAMMQKYDEMCDANTALKEKMRQAELALAEKEAGPRGPSAQTTSAPDEAHAHAHITVAPSSRSSALAAAAGRGPVSDAGGGNSGARDNGGLGVGGLDLRLTQELVATKVAAESANRRAEMMEADRDRVRRSLDEAQGRLQELEARIAQASGELEMARQSRTSLEQRLMGAKTRAEADELIRRLDAAEQVANQRLNDHANLTHRAEESERRLEEATRDRQRHLAELTNLRAALRDAMGRSEHAVQVGMLHEQLDHAFAKEALARSALNRSELARIDMDNELRGLKSELVKITARVVAHQDQARWADRQRQEAQCQLDLCNAGRTEAWKSKLWSRKLQQLKAHNEAMTHTLHHARQRITKQEEKREAAELKLEYVEDVGAMLRKGVSEVMRDAARLHEQIMQLCIERGRLQREEVLMRERVNYAERVNAELHELIEKNEAEFYQQQEDLERDKAAIIGQARSLQDEITQLQEQLRTTMAELAASSGSTSRDTHPRRDQGPRRPFQGGQAPGGRGPGGGGGGGAVQGVGLDTGNLKQNLAQAAMGDRDAMLRQIEALKTARQKARTMEQEVESLQEQLEATRQELSDVRRYHNEAMGRVREQNEALLQALEHQRAQGGADDDAVAQVKAVAEVAVAELKARLQERDAALEALEANMAQKKAEWMEQRRQDRAQIEELNQRLFNRNNASIGNMKDLLTRVTPTGPDESNTGAQLRHLKDALTRTNDDMAVLRNQLEQKDAALALLQRNQEAQLMKQNEELVRLRAEAGSNAREEGSARAALAKMQSAARSKDDKLRQLRDAFKTLEGKLVDAHTRIADRDMEGAGEESSMLKELSKAKASIARLEKEKGELSSQLSMAQEAASKPAPGTAGDPSMVRMHDQLQQAQKRTTGLEEELHRTRAALQKLKNAERTVVDLTSGMSIEASRRIEELQRRINVLEKQNTALTTKARTLQDHSTSTSIDFGAHGFRGSGPPDGGGGGSRPSSTRTTTTAAHPSQHGSLSRGGGVARGGRPSSSGSGRGSRGPGGQPSGGGAAGEGGGDEGGSRGGSSGSDARGPHQPQQQQQQQQQMPGVSTAPDHPSEAAAKSAAAVAAWEESKRLGKRVEELRKKLAGKQEEVTAARTEADKKSTQVASLQGELDKQAIAFRDLQEKLRRAQAVPKLTTDAAKLREYVDKIERSEAECDSLRQQLARAQSQAASAARAAGAAGRSSSTGDDELLKKDMELHELRLQRDQAQVQVRRLKDRLAELFGPEAGSSKGSGRGGAGMGGGAREAELMATIGTLKTALEKATTSTTPTTKYMAEVTRRKEVVRELEAAKAEVSNLRGAAGAAARLMAEMQAANAELRTQLSRALQGVAAGGGPGAAVSEAATAQATNLEMLLDQRDKELQRLRHMLEEKEQQLAGAMESSGTSADADALRAALEEAESENEALRAELNAFDPKFFEEIEDLKHDHYVLSMKVDDYERVIQQLSAQLGCPPPISRSR